MFFIGVTITCSTAVKSSTTKKQSFCKKPVAPFMSIIKIFFFSLPCTNVSEQAVGFMAGQGMRRLGRDITASAQCQQMSLNDKRIVKHPSPQSEQTLGYTTFKCGTQWIKHGLCILLYTQINPFFTLFTLWKTRQMYSQWLSAKRAKTNLSMKNH